MGFIKILIISLSTLLLSSGALANDSTPQSGEKMTLGNNIIVNTVEVQASGKKRNVSMPLPGSGNYCAFIPPSQYGYVYSVGLPRNSESAIVCFTMDNSHAYFAVYEETSKNFSCGKLDAYFSDGRFIFLKNKDLHVQYIFSLSNVNNEARPDKVTVDRKMRSSGEIVQDILKGNGPITIPGIKVVRVSDSFIDTLDGLTKSRFAPPALARPFREQATFISGLETHTAYAGMSLPEATAFFNFPCDSEDLDLTDNMGNIVGKGHKVFYADARADSNRGSFDKSGCEKYKDYLRHARSPSMEDRASTPAPPRSIKVVYFDQNWKSIKVENLEYKISRINY